MRIKPTPHTTFEFIYPSRFIDEHLSINVHKYISNNNYKIAFDLENCPIKNKIEQQIYLNEPQELLKELYE